MLNSNVSVSNLCIFLDSQLGKGTWGRYEPETLMIEFGVEHDPMFIEKFRVLQAFLKGVMNALSRPEFFLLAMPVLNNEPANFDWIELPTCLELAWGIEQAKRTAMILGQTFKPTESFREIVEYVLKEEGFSAPTEAFPFVNGTLLEEGASPEAMDLKLKGIQAYIEYMEEMSHV